MGYTMSWFYEHLPCRLQFLLDEQHCHSGCIHLHLLPAGARDMAQLGRYRRLG